MSGKSLSGAKDDVKGSNDKENIVENLSSSKDDVKGSEEKSELSDSQKIIDEIHKIYANRLKRIDDEAGSDGMELKVKTLQEWVNDLGEQNSMLVRTVERLEKEAADRVSLLEDNLQRSALIAQEFMKKYKNCSKKLKDNIEETEEELNEARKKVENSKKTEKKLQGVIKKLQEELDSLKKIIDEGKKTQVDAAISKAAPNPPFLFRPLPAGDLTLPYYVGYIPPPPGLVVGGGYSVAEVCYDPTGYDGVPILNYVPYLPPPPSTELIHCFDRPDICCHCLP